MTTKNTPAKQESNVPSFYKEFNVSTTEGIGSEDMVIPMIKTCYGVSGIKDTDSKIKEGDLYNSATGEIISQPFKFILLFAIKFYIMWNKEEKKLMCRCAIDPETKEKIYSGPMADDPPPLDDKRWDNGYEYWVIPIEELKNAIKNHDFPLPIKLPFSRSQVIGARKLNTKIKMNEARHLPCFSQVISTTMNVKKYPSGNAWIPTFEFGEIIKDEKVGKFLFEYHLKCKELSKNKVVHEDNSGDDVETIVEEEKNKDEVPF
jgi:hypothetical protein